MFSLIQLQADTIANAATGAVVENISPNTEISVLQFIFKGGLFLIPIAILLFYTFYVIIERYLFINKAAKIDYNLIRDVRDNLNSGNLDTAVILAERSGTAAGII